MTQLAERGRKKKNKTRLSVFLSARQIICVVLPFIPNLERRPYLLMRTKRTRRRTQAKPANPTAMET